MARPCTNRIPVRVTVAAIGLLAAATLAACSGSSSGGGSQPTPTNAATPTATSTTTATATVTKSAAAPATTSSGTETTSSNGGGNSGDGSGSDTSAYCKESQLRAEIEAKPVAGSGEHGRKAVIVDFLNKSDSTCVLYGYPGAAVLSSSGTQVKQATRTIRGELLGYAPGHDTLVHVSLKPGAVATAGIEGVDQQEQGAAQAGCDAAPNPRIEVTPPNTAIPVPFDVAWPQCYSFAVHPVNYLN